MAQLQFQDFPGRFAAGRQNALGMQQQQQQISAEAQQAPIRNQLNQLNLQQAQVGAQRGERDDSQQQALKRNQVLHQVSKTLLNNIPEEQWPQAIKSLGPQLKALDIDVDLLTQTPTRKEVEQMAQVTGALSNNPEALGRAQRELELDLKKRNLDQRERFFEGKAGQAGDIETAKLESKTKLEPNLAKQKELAKDAAQLSTEIFGRISGVEENIRNMQEGIKLIDEGAATGPINKWLPSFRASTVKLDNLKNRLGLDVIGSVTFGALSAGELKVAFDTAVPANLQGDALKDWFSTRIEAQTNLLGALEDAGIFLAEDGANIPKLMSRRRQQRNQQTQPAQAAQPEQGGGLSGLSDQDLLSF